MNGNRWHTKEDVQNDLGVTGLLACDFNEDCIVRGEKAPPPPRHLTDDDDEINLRYGAIGDISSSDDVMGPDLAGITQMLRMVDKYDRPHEDVPEIDWRRPPKHTIVISKLNPNVKEFIPKEAKSSSNSTDSKNVENKTSNVKSIDLETKIVNSNKKQMAEMLKSKIGEALKSDTIQHKKERNCAIAALMKLHSKPAETTSKTTSNSNSPNINCDTPTSTLSHSSLPKPVLFSPEYFEGRAINIHNSEQSIPGIIDETSSSSVSDAKPNSSDIDPHVRESIKKVNSWLNKPDKPLKPKDPVLYTDSQLTFKKKDTTSSSSSNSIVKSIPTIPAQISATPSYVPSQYASTLAKQYEERNKAKDAKVDIWTKLENDLKAKDEELRKKMTNESRSNDETLNMTE